MPAPNCAPSPAPWSSRRGALRFFAVLALSACGWLLAFEPASAQYLAFPSAPSPVKKKELVDRQGQKQMLVQAREIDCEMRFELSGWSETHVTQRFWLVSVLAAMLGVALALV